MRTRGLNVPPLPREVIPLVSIIGTGHTPLVYDLCPRYVCFATYFQSHLTGVRYWLFLMTDGRVMSVAVNPEFYEVTATEEMWARETQFWHHFVKVRWHGFGGVSVN